MARGSHLPVRRAEHGRSALLVAMGLVIASIALRLALLPAMPCLSRDGVRFCEYARALGAHGPAALRDPTFAQHPLHPLIVLAANRTLRGLGWADNPSTWQAAAQSASMLGTGVLIAALAIFAARCAAGLRLRRHAPLAAALAAALGALLPLHVGLSIDGLSDPLHAGLFLTALGCLAAPPTLAAAAGAGFFAGLAFLTRPEGAAALLVGLLVIGLSADAGKRRAGRLARPACAAVVFALVAGPYVAWIGGLSPKADKQTVEEFLPHAAADIDRPVELAAAVRDAVPWTEAPIRAMYETARGARVVVLVAALPALWLSRRRLRSPALRALWLAGAIDLLLVTVLVARHGYLDPRHTLLAVELLIVLAGVSLAALHGAAKRGGLFWVCLVLVVAPLAGYALRVPNGADTQIPAAAAAIREASAGLEAPRVLAAGSARRVGFYAGAEVIPWNLYAPTLEERFADVRGYVLDPDPRSRPHFVALETGPGEHHAGAAELLDRLRADPAAGPLIRGEQVFAGGRGVALHVLRIGAETSANPSPD